MLYARYLWTIAQAIQHTLQPELQTADAKNAAAACVRALAGIASSLEDPTYLERADVPGGAEMRELAAIFDRPARLMQAPPLLSTLGGGVENTAARGEAATGVAAAARWIEIGAWHHDALKAGVVADLVRWEKSQLDASARVVDRCESAQTDMEPSDLKIDRESLERYLQGRPELGPGVRITRLTQAIGGRSKQTALFTLTGTRSLPEQLVVRRDHPANSQGRSVTTEFPILSAIHRAGIRVPVPYIAETSPLPLGAPFVIMEQLPGAVAGLDYFAPPVRSEALALGLAEQLGKLHKIAYAELDLTLPQTLKTNDRQGWIDDLAQIRAAWNKLARGPSITVATALSWLEANVECLDQRLAIVHNDAHFHNVLALGEEITGLLDWELVHIGHPGEDLGYCRPVIEKMLEWPKFMAAYLAAGGQPLTQRQLDYFSLRAILFILTAVQMGRDAFDSARTDDLMLMEVGASFIPKLHHRLTNLVDAILNS